MWPITTDVTRSVGCVCVCLVTQTCHTKTAELMKMPFGEGRGWADSCGSQKPCIRGGQDPTNPFAGPRGRTAGNATFCQITLDTQSELYLALDTKISPCGTDGRLFTTDVSAKFKVMWHKNRDKYKKSGPIKFRYCAL